MTFTFTYKEHTFEIDVNNEKIECTERGVRKDYYDNVYRIGCDKELYYSVISKACWVATSKDIKELIKRLYIVIKKHYSQYKNESELTWDNFLKLLPQDFKNNYYYNLQVMDSIRTTKEILKEWCERNLDTHTDWVGTRVETVNEMESIDEFVDKLYEFLEDNDWKC